MNQPPKDAIAKGVFSGLFKFFVLLPLCILAAAMIITVIGLLVYTFWVR